MKLLATSEVRFKVRNLQPGFASYRSATWKCFIKKSFINVSLLEKLAVKYLLLCLNFKNVVA